MARSLAFKNVQKALRAAQGEAEIESDLPPGHMRLWSNFKPNLRAGHYGIEVKQSIKSPNGNEALDVFNYDPAAAQTILPQRFDVVAPQFSLDPKVINSYYPPDGHQDEGRVLPHIVFNDPHIPWDRVQTVGRDFQVAGPLISERVAIPPWIALAVFDPSELTLDAADGLALNISGFNEASLPSSGAYSMPVGQYISNIKSRITYEQSLVSGIITQDDWNQLGASTEPTTVIFPTKARAKEIFSPAVKFALMSHVREINTDGLPDAGEDKGFFSVCISHVSGLLKNTRPTTVVVHLVSIENFMDTNIDDPGVSDRIGMVSLFNWTYLSVPPDPLNFKDVMVKLKNTMQPLRPPKPALDDLLADANKPELKAAAQNLYNRFSLGYSLGRWRTQTGEETVSFFRGPLSPTPTPWKPSSTNDWPASSNTGKEFQILDRDLGVMDLTYSSAWQLGKLLAIQDTVFNSALLRFRSTIHKWAASQTRMQINHVVARDIVLHDVGNVISGIKKIEVPSSLPVRNILPSKDQIAPPLTNPQVAPIFHKAVVKAVTLQAGSGATFFNDYKLDAANNSDWEIIHKWISDKLYLSDIPSHYLFTDPSHLPPEALRFFYIDDAWLDCFIDGALSVANHFDPLNDTVRKQIKEVYNTYLRTHIDPTKIKPPNPRYGFVIRSAIIKAMPDIKLTVKCRKMTGPNAFSEDTSRTPLVRYTKMDEYTIFALLDCLPEEIWFIRLAQPPHQQRYVAAEKLVPTQVHRIRTVYSKGAPAPGDETGSWDPITTPLPAGVDLNKWFNIDTRCIDIITMGVGLFSILPFQRGDAEFKVQLADSGVFALELNDSCYQIDFTPPVGSSTTTATPRDRQLWTGPATQNLVTGGVANLMVRDEPASPAKSKTHSRSISHSSSKTSKSGRSKHTKSTSHFEAKPTSPTSIRATPLSQSEAKSFLLKRLNSLSVHPTTLKLSKVTPLNAPHSLSRASILPLKPHLPTTSPTTSTSFAPNILALTIPTNPQYTISIRPSYRPAAPLPYQPQGAPEPIYAPDAFIPTTTINLIDLIVTISPRSPGVPSSQLLASLVVSIPLANPTTLTTPAIEALLDTTSQPGVKMIYNRRLFPYLSVSPRMLTITLSPRAAALNETRGLGLDSVQDASFKLTSCSIAAIKTPVIVPVVGENRVPRGVVNVKLVERYLNPGPGIDAIEGVSDVSVIKREGGDVDGGGRAV